MAKVPKIVLEYAGQRTIIFDNKDLRHARIWQVKRGRKIVNP